MADILNQIQEIVEQKDMVIQDLQRELKQKDEEIRQLKDCLNVSVTAHQKVEKQLAEIKERADKIIREKIFKFALEEGGDKLFLIEVIDETFNELFKEGEVE